MLFYKIKNIFFLIFTINNFGLLVLSEIPRPRGVSLTKANLYTSSNNEFVCLDGKKIIKYTHVNDDFCDCDDASDEPGTAACPNGMFHCSNAGFKPKYIPSSRVNDGICDCCDASDEYNSPNAKCINVCSELGREEKLKEKQKAELTKMGSQMRTELIQRGKTIKSEYFQRLQELEKSKIEAEAVKIEKEKIKIEVEDIENAALQIYRDAQENERKEQQIQDAENNKEEAESTFKKFDSNSNNLLEINEIQTRITFDKNRDGEVSIEEAKFFLDENDQIDMETFISVAWPRMKPYLMIDSGLFKPPHEKPVENNEPEHADNTDLDNEHYEDMDPGHDADGGDEELPDEDEEEETGEGEIETTSQAQEPTPEYDPETKKLIEEANEARNQYTVADRELREIETELNNIKDLLEKDFGADEEYAPLNGECFNFEDREYVYKLCPFDRASQQPKSGGAETRLGTWHGWTGTENKYHTMLYSNGASCWNGPQRSATVHIDCGLDTRVLSVSEPNRCEYVFQMQTPAACTTADDATGEKDAHDEL